MTVIVAAFYHFFDFPDYEEKRDAMLATFKQHHIKGSLLIAAEGFNGTISGTRENIDAILHYLKTEIAKEEFDHKESVCDEQPFARAKVRLKKETISIGEKTPPIRIKETRADGSASPELRPMGNSKEFTGGNQTTGEYVDAKDWNALISDPNVIVLDARNNYEHKLGTFEGATDPGTRVFKEMPDYIRKNLADKKDQPIASFCTGGIRCEKLTAWLKNEGFEKVYHLKGGILQYLEDVPKEDSKWQGECFVFDERIAVDHDLAPRPHYTLCPCCGLPVTEEDKQRDDYVEGKSCRFCIPGKTE